MTVKEAVAEINKNRMTVYRIKVYNDKRKMYEDNQNVWNAQVKCCSQHLCGHPGLFTYVIHI